MVFLNIYLLGGLALLGVPVVVHLDAQKPRRLPFPAFRFLRQRSVINRRRMRLQHLLLLALRMLVLAALCFAIAQPKLFLPRAMAEVVRPEQSTAGRRRVRFRRELPHGIPRRRPVAGSTTPASAPWTCCTTCPPTVRSPCWTPATTAPATRRTRTGFHAGAGALAHQRPASAAGAGAAGSPDREGRRDAGQGGRRPASRRRGCSTSSRIARRRLGHRRGQANQNTGRRSDGLHRPRR